jgi:hypothetical protein
MTRTCLLAALLLLTGCGSAPPTSGSGPCAGGEASQECQVYRYANSGM